MNLKSVSSIVNLPIRPIMLLSIIMQLRQISSESKVNIDTININYKYIWYLKLNSISILIPKCKKFFNRITNNMIAITVKK